MTYSRRDVPFGMVLVTIMLLGLVVSMPFIVSNDAHSSTASTSQNLPLSLSYALSQSIGANHSDYHALNTQGGYELINNDLKATIDAQSVTFADDAGNQWQLNLESLGYGDTLAPVAAPTLSAEENRVSLDRGNLTEWYINGSLGLQQGFTLQNPPGIREGDLTLALRISGNLRIGSVEGDSLTLLNEQGAVAYTYGGLIAYDAEGRRLPITMTAHDGTIYLRVDDRGAVYPVTVDPWIQQAYLKASNSAAGIQFGYAVGISGNTAVVSAPYEDTTQTDSGALYVFVRSGEIWTEQAFIKTNPVVAGSLLGEDIDIDGDTIIAGAPGEGTAQSGAAYIFTRTGTTWTQQARLTPDNITANNVFGDSVAVSGDTVAVASSNETVQVTGSGSIYVFVNSGGTWTKQTVLTVSNAGVGDRLGSGGNVALEGDTLVAGTYLEDGVNDTLANSGAAYVFERVGVDWSEMATLRASNAGINDFFGTVVEISGDTIVVSAELEDGLNDDVIDSGAVYVFVGKGTSWTEEAILRADNAETLDYFGRPAIDGDLVAVGAFGEDGLGNDTPDSGAVYVYSRIGTTWTQLDTIHAINADPDDQLGDLVAMSGNTIIAGAWFEDAATSGVDGDGLNNRAPESGAAYIFDYEGEPIPQTTISNQDVIEDRDGGSIFPTFSFVLAVDDNGDAIPVEWINLVITDANDSPILDEWFPYDRYCSGFLCRIPLTPDLLPAGLVNGEYFWKVRTWHPSTGLTDFSPEAQFTVDVPAPGVPTNVQVSTTGGRIVISFDFDSAAAWYHIVIRDADGNVLYDGWHNVGEMVCDGIICSFVLPPLPGLVDGENGTPGLSNGNYTVEITAWGPGGFNGGDPSSSAFEGFVVNVGEAGLATIPPDFAITNTDSGSPTFRWLPAENATYQLLWIGTPTGLPDALTSTLILTYHIKWYPVDEMECLEGAGNPCLFTPQDVFLANGTYEYWVLSWGPAGASRAGTFLGWTQGPVFDVDADTPVPPVPLTPSGTLSSGVTSFGWQPVPGITWYNLWIGTFEDGMYTTAYQNWHRATEIGCLETSMCTVYPEDLYLPEDDYLWYVQSYNPAWVQANAAAYWSLPPGEFTVDRP